MPMDWVIGTNSLSADLLRPDINIFIDVAPETGMKRLSDGRSSTELYETFENLKNVRDKYFEAFEQLKSHENIFITDGNRAPEIIAAEIRNEVSRVGSRMKKQ
jgi:dTMP kinase